MQWHSIGEFLAMGGYGFYVWGSVGACAVVMLAEPWLLRRQHRRLLHALRQRRDGGTQRGGTVVVEGTR